jgi:putative ABC transport system ATP-binding protein
MRQGNSHAAAASKPPVIQLRQVARTYPGPPPVPALRPCDLRVDAGDYLTIVGPSGSGKSTLLNMLGLLDRPTEGVYLLEGIDTSALTEDERTALRGTRLGFVFQSFHLIDHRTATDNVGLGLLYRSVSAVERRDRAVAALESVDLGHRLDATPATMSGGERQRVAIARALVGRPAVLLCDEPTGNLDSRTTDNVLAILDGLHDTGITIMVITHEESVANRGTRTVRISDGTLTEQVAS